MTENQISYLIRRAVYDVYFELGPGLLESVYCAVLFEELLEAGLDVKKEWSVGFFRKGLRLEPAFRLDFLVEDKVLVEVKSVEALLPVHHKQVLTYLKLTNLKLGILVNFNCDQIKGNIFRIVNGL